MVPAALVAEMPVAVGSAAEDVEAPAAALAAAASRICEYPLSDQGPGGSNRPANLCEMHSVKKLAVEYPEGIFSSERQNEIAVVTITMQHLIEFQRLTFPYRG